MNEIFRNAVQQMVVTDNGIEYHNPTINRHVLYPYGSMTTINLSFTGLFTISDGNITSQYNVSKEEKSKLKALIPTLQQLNSKASASKLVEITESKTLEKNVDSFMDYFNLIYSKRADVWKTHFESIINSMLDEEILYGFNGALLHINGGRDSVVSFIGLITTKRFYYAGFEGKAIVSYLKSGTIELKDVHAITLGVQTLSFPAYVQFEVKNDDYKLGIYGNTQLVKEKLEEGIKACEKSQSTAAIVQAVISPADELKKFKELLDMGAINQEEFDAKKKELLGL